MRGLSEIMRSCPGSNCPLLNWRQYLVEYEERGCRGWFCLEQAGVYSRGNITSQEVRKISKGNCSWEGSPRTLPNSNCRCAIGFFRYGPIGNRQSAHESA